MQNHTRSMQQQQQQQSTGAIKFDIYRRNTSLIAGFRIAGVTTAVAAASSFDRRRLRVALARLKMLTQLLLVFICIALPTQCVAVGYSYARFVGPVRGPEHKVLVHDALNGGSHVDFIAKPEYEFAYGVEDATTHVLQNRQESRDGDEVRGVYSVFDPDGTLRVVKYTADDVNGFQAEVITNGIPTFHGHNVPQHVADGKDNGNINWQSVHTLPPPLGVQHKVQHEVHHTDDAANSNDDVTSNNVEDANEDQAEHTDDGAGKDEVYEEYDESDENEAGEKEADEKEADEIEESEENDAYEDASKETQSHENESDDEYY